MEEETGNTEPVMVWLLSPPRNNLLKIYKLRRANYEEQIRGIDLIGTGFFNEVSIENKIRKQDYGDLLIEIKSKKEQDTWGWIEYSVADYLIYVTKTVDTIKGSIFKMGELQKWWKTQNDEDYETKEALNLGYTTVNKVVPYKNIPKEIYIYSDYLNL